MSMTGGTAKLLHTGYADGNTAHPIKLYAYYKIIQYPEDNLSVVSCGMYITTVSGWWIGPWADSKGSYVGDTPNTFDGSIGKVDGTHWLVENVRIPVEHDPDGTGNFTFRWKWGVNSPWGRVQYPSGSFTITLPAIPRASTLDCPEEWNLAENMDLFISPAKEGFRHKLTYRIGRSYGIIIDKTSQSLATYWRPQPFLARENPDGRELECVFTLETFQTEGDTEPIGTRTYYTILHIPNTATFQPNLTASFAPDGALIPADFPANLYIESKSRVVATWSVFGSYGANILDCTLGVNGTALTGESPLESGFLKAGKQTVTLTATDSRGYRAVASEEITVLPYAPPRLIPAAGEGEILLCRVDADGAPDDAGGSIRVKAGVKFAPLTLDGTDYNRVSLELLVTGSDLITAYEIEMNGTECDVILGDGALSPRKSYSAVLRVTDRLGGVGESSLVVPTEKITLHLGPGGGVGVGKYAEDPDGFDVALPATFRAGITIGEERLADFVASREGADGWVAERRASGDLLLLGSLTLVDQPTGVPILTPLPARVGPGTAILSFTGTTLPMPVSVTSDTLAFRLVPIHGEETDSGTLGVLLWASAPGEGS